MQLRLIRKMAPYSIVFMVFAVAIGAFFAFSGVVYSQSTGAPGLDTDAENVSGLIRVDDEDGTGLQIKSGSLRIGSAKTIDLNANFEVFGDLFGHGSLLIAGDGVCQTSSCKFSDEGTVKNVPFLVQKDDDFVGVGTNNIVDSNVSGYSPGLLAIYSQENRFPNGAAYATSTSNHGVYAKTSQSLRAGIYSFASGAYMYGVFGKAVDIENRGITGIKPDGGTIAGLFKGNVLVSGGFMQGNASGLIRVGSINDASLPAGDGGRGLGAWATRQDIAVPAKSTTVYAMNLGDGELLRSLDILVAEDGSTEYRTYGTHVRFSLTPISVTYNAEELTIINTSIFAYNVRFVAHIETGISIRVTHGFDTVSDYQPELYKSGDFYKLTADVSASVKNFSWKFVTSPARGSLCGADQNGNVVTSTCTKDGTITGQTIYYQQPSAYSGTPPSETFKIRWEGGTGDIFRDITLQLVDVKAKTNVAEYGEDTALSVISTPAPSYVQYSLVNAKRDAVENLTSNGVYTPPAISLFSEGYDEKVTVRATYEDKLSIEYDVYIVPRINVTTKFPDGPQAGQASSTVANGLALNAEVALSGLEVGVNPSYATISGACINADSTSCTSELVKNSNSLFVLTPNSIQTKTLAFTWTPPVAEVQPNGVYPSSLSFTDDLVNPHEVYVSKISSSGGGTGTPRDITFTITGWENSTGLLSTLLPMNELEFTNPFANQHIGGYGTLGSIINTAPNITTARIISTAASNYYVKGRNPNDYRDTSQQTVVVPGGSTCTCVKGDEICCSHIGGER